MVVLIVQPVSLVSTNLPGLESPVALRFTKEGGKPFPSDDFKRRNRVKSVKGVKSICWVTSGGKCRELVVVPDMPVGTENARALHKLVMAIVERLNLQYVNVKFLTRWGYDAGNPEEWLD